MVAALESPIVPVSQSRKMPERPEIPICMGISRYFVLEEFFLAQILSDGLPTISGVRSVTDLTPKKISE